MGLHVDTYGAVQTNIEQQEQLRVKQGQLGAELDYATGEYDNYLILVGLGLGEAEAVIKAI